LQLEHHGIGVVLGLQRGYEEGGFWHGGVFQDLEDTKKTGAGLQNMMHSW
jgi:hypothetical protein